MSAHAGAAETTVTTGRALTGETTSMTRDAKGEAPVASPSNPSMRLKRC
ncbi:MAG TPA: hypothetical protein VF668_07310 [Pyrinomonadaceae bacterium]|jgi:hypothetical protein